MRILCPMADIEMKQFKISDEGDVLFQPDPSNPLPGKPVGKIKKGAAILAPVAEVTDGEIPTEKIAEWLTFHIHEVLQPLLALKDEEQIQENARTIADRLFDAFGILPRAELEDVIAGLDEEGRAALRARKVRLGPVLAFLPLLNKPAAVRLRALLWNLWYDKPLPASVPPDGVTSISVTDQDVDPLYYRAIGYPVYGPRAIRVDMLDRLICAIYDSADKGVFKAQHEMAEWLGCTIPDLYAVLEAMDHKKIHDPAAGQEEKAEETPEKSEENPAEVPEEKTETKPAEQPAAEDQKAEGEKPPVPQEKPELATFHLRRGKAYGKPPRREKPKQHKAPQKRSRKPKRTQRKEPQERIISAVPKKQAENSPFAVLKDLKVQNKDQ